MGYLVVALLFTGAGVWLWALCVERQGCLWDWLKRFCHASESEDNPRRGMTSKEVSSDD